MASKVYFSEKFDDGTISRLYQLASADMDEGFTHEDRVAVKVHFGEKGNSRFVPPEMIAPALKELGKHNNNHFITDTNTLYRGMRTNASDHVKIAQEHGFGKLDTEIIIGDGELGDDDVDVEIKGDIFKSVRIGRFIAESDGIFLVSHFKGHMLFGFGGALKNLAMGCGSRAGKLAMHSKVSPTIDKASCVACGICGRNCDVDAIDMVEFEDDTFAQINDKCIGCAKCISVCPQGAVQIPWRGATSIEAQKRGAEYALGALKAKKLLCMSFIRSITKWCDCASDSEIIGKDIGIVAGTDPVAVDQACYDLTLKGHKGKDIFQKAGNPDGRTMLEYAEELGIGKRKYELVRIE